MAGTLQGAPGAGRDADAAARRASRLCPRAAARTFLRAAVRAAGLRPSTRVPTRSTTRSPSGARARTSPVTPRGRPCASRPADALLRADPRARRRQALLGRRRRGREAAAPRRGLAGRPPRARADRPPLPRSTGGLARAQALARLVAEEDRRTPTSRESRTTPRRRRSRSRSASTSSGSARCSRRCKRQRRDARARPRLRRGQAAAALLRRAAVRARSSASTSRSARWRSARRPAAPGRLAPTQRERVELLQGSLTYRDQRAGGLRRGRGGRGDRAPRPAAAGRLRAGRVRARPARRRSSSRRPTPSTTSQFESAAGRAASATATTASSGREPSSQHWARRVAGALRLRACASCRSAPRTRSVGAPTQMAVFTPVTTELTDPRAVAGRADRRVRVGKSTFARKHFLPTEVLSSDFCRGLVSDDENDQAATDDAFEVLHFIAAQAAGRGRLTVVDATNVQPEARKPLVALAREYHCLPVAIVLDLPERLCQDRNAARGPTATSGRTSSAPASSSCAARCAACEREGFRHVYVLSSPEEVDGGDRRARSRCGTTAATSTARSTSSATCTAAATNSRAAGELGYRLGRPAIADAPTSGTRRAARRCSSATWSTAARTSPDVLRLVCGMVAAGAALCVPATTTCKLLRKLAATTCRSPTAWPNRSRSSTAEPRRSSATQVADVPRRAGQPLRARRRQAGGRPRRAEGGDAGPRLAARCATSPSTARPPARPTSSACRSATTGRPSTAARRWSSTATRRCPRPSG